MLFSFESFRKSFSQEFAAKIAAGLAVVITTGFAAITGVGIAHQERWVIDGSSFVCNDGVVDTPAPASVTMHDYLYNPVSKLLWNKATFIIDGLEGGRIHVVVENFDEEAEIMSATLYCSHHSGPLARIVRVHRLPNNQYRILGQHGQGEFAWDLTFMTRQAFAEQMNRLMAKASDVSRWRGRDMKGREIFVERALDSSARFNVIIDDMQMHFCTKATTPVAEVAKLIAADERTIGNIVVSQAGYGALHVVAFDRSQSLVFVGTVLPCNLRTSWASSKAQSGPQS